MIQSSFGCYGRSIKFSNLNKVDSLIHKTMRFSDSLKYKGKFWMIRKMNAFQWLIIISHLINVDAH